MTTSRQKIVLKVHKGVFPIDSYIDNTIAPRRISGVTWTVTPAENHYHSSLEGALYSAVVNLDLTASATDPKDEISRLDFFIADLRAVLKKDVNLEIVSWIQGAVSQPGSQTPQNERNAGSADSSK